MKTKTNFLATIGAALVLLSSALPTFAQEATTSAETTQELKKRIEKVVSEKKDQVKGVLDTLGVQKTGFIGEVTRVTQDSITVEYEARTNILPIDESISLIKDRRPTKVDDVAVGNWALVVGTGERNDFSAEQIFIFANSLKPRPQVVMLGSVEELTTRNLTITPRNEETSRQFTITSKTELQNQDGSEVTLKNFDTNVQVLVTGFTTDTGMEASPIRSLAPMNAE